MVVPCWACPRSANWQIDFRTDLDIIAPLGSGEENAALWFKDFVKNTGPRWHEVEEATNQLIDLGGQEDVLPPDHSLLLEAEPWCDRASLSYSSRIFAFDGPRTQMVSLVVPLLLARSWVARGNTQTDAGKALEDYRRTIRLGRLLRQDDTTVYYDLGGLACIRLGLGAVFDLATRRGDSELALKAAIALGEVDPQQQRTRGLMKLLDLSDAVVESAPGKVKLEVTESRFEQLLEMAERHPNRRFRLMAILELAHVATFGSPPQSTRAQALLKQLRDSADPLTAKTVAWIGKNPPQPEAYAAR
jgi:hypothetical protein